MTESKSKTKKKVNSQFKSKTDALSSRTVKVIMKLDIRFLSRITCESEKKLMNVTSLSELVKEEEFARIRRSEMGTVDNHRFLKLKWTKTKADVKGTPSLNSAKTEDDVGHMLLVYPDSRNHLNCTSWTWKVLKVPELL